MRERVLVTGASGGIGRAVALELAKAGLHVTLHYRSGEDAAKDALAEIESGGGQGTLLGFDVADRKEARERSKPPWPRTDPTGASLRARASTPTRRSRP